MSDVVGLTTCASHCFLCRRDIRHGTKAPAIAIGCLAWPELAGKFNVHLIGVHLWCDVPCAQIISRSPVHRPSDHRGPARPKPQRSALPWLTMLLCVGESHGVQWVVFRIGLFALAVIGRRMVGMQRRLPGAECRPLKGPPLGGPTGGV
ncbi:hypothetical protein D3C72_1600430 [compost metagenome]